ncbi:MAG: response regulator [bacterium]
MEDQKIGQILLRENIITEAQLQEALQAQEQAYGKSIGEVLMEFGYIEESDLLRLLAKQFHTQYLTTKKLSELKVPEIVLKMVPQNVAEKHRLFPVQYKRSEKTLTIVMTNPQNVAAVDEVTFVSGIGTVKALVGMEEAIQAAIDKWYKKDESAFNRILGSGDGMAGYELQGSSFSQDLGEQDKSLDLSQLVSSSKDEGQVEIVPEGEEAEEDDRISLGADTEDEEGVFLGGMADMPGDDNTARDQVVIQDMDSGAEENVEEVMVSPVGGSEASEQVQSVEEVEQKPSRRSESKRYRLRMLVVESHENIKKFIVKLFNTEGFRVHGVKSREEAVEALESEEYDSLVIKEQDLGEGEEFANRMAEQFPAVQLCIIKDYASAVIGETRQYKNLMTSFLETLDILVGLLEMESGGMRGHSHNVGKYSRLLASKLDLLQKEIDSIALAGYVHDLGKKGMYHWSAFKVDKNTDPEQLMEQTEIPLKLLASAKYPFDIKPVIKHQYEKWDGSGLPDGLKGEEIPVGSRVLSIVEAFEDLTNKSSGQEPLEATAALEKIKQASGSLFDPDLVDYFMGVVRDDIYLQQISEGQEKVLVVDTEMEMLTLLELRLVNMGFNVSTAKTAEDALEKASAENPSLIITETDLPDYSGFEFIEKIKQEPETKDVPFLFLASKDDSNSVTKGFRLGAEDYMIKPVRIEILAAKINNLMTKLRSEKKTESKAAGVSGSLSEMALPDIIQIMGAGRKTGRIILENNGKSCSIDMEDGQVVNASVDDLKGEEAFYQILYWSEGSFTIDPTAEISERLITVSYESLMLEGYRRMDEAGKEEGGPEDDIQMDGSDFI